jgi:NifU-like protein involved in Fe-S cluster formation
MGSDQTENGSDRTIIGHGGNPPGQGPFLDLSLKIQDGRICGASYETYQCPGSHACGKAICEMVTGRSLGEARTLRHDDLVSRVGPLPPHRQHCYGLALVALADALGALEMSREEGKIQEKRTTCRP